VSGKKREFVLGDRVVLIMDAHHPNGAVIPEGTVGTICGVARWLPQVDFDGLGVKAVAPHALQVLDVPDGALLPDDGTPLGAEELLGLVIDLAWENHQLRHQLARAEKEAKA
jgi:cysteine synthase